VLDQRVQFRLDADLSLDDLSRPFRWRWLRYEGVTGLRGHAEEGATVEIDDPLHLARLHPEIDTPERDAL
jgi:hypothetical protein